MRKDTNDNVVPTAIFDRHFHNCYPLFIKGKNYRMKNVVKLEFLFGQFSMGINNSNLLALNSDEYLVTASLDIFN